jgi:hypothetical protein
MKQNIFFILILLLALQLGCKGKEIPTPTAPELKLGTISNLTVNGNSLPRTGDNYIFIDSFDKTKNEVTGTMNVTYIATGTSETSRAIYPDTLRFENAKFTAPLNN